jgi:flagellar biosynthetic protein FliO
MNLNSPSGSVMSSAAVGLTLLLLMLAAAFWLIKRSQSLRTVNPRLLAVLASQALGPAQQLQLVRVGDRTLLLGVCAQSITVLLTVEGPLPDIEEPGVKPIDSSGSGFTQLLQSMTRR